MAHALIATTIPGIRIVGRSVGLSLSEPQLAVGVRLTVGSRRWCQTFDTLVTDRPNRLQASGYRTPTLDCGNRRMLRALGR